MNAYSGQTRLLESRVAFLEQTLKEMAKKNIQIQHKTMAIQNKQVYLQDVIQKMALQLNQLQLTNSHQQKYGLSDITPYQNLAISHSQSKQNSLKSLNSGSNSQILQLFQTLQSQTINNLEKVDSKISLSHEQLESKCSKMELRMLAIWKQAENLIQNLTFQIQTNQLKIRSFQDRMNRDRQIITTTIASLEDRLSSFSYSQNSQFSQDMSTLRSSLENQLKTLGNKINNQEFSQILEATKAQFHTAIKSNNDKLMEKVTSQIEENLKNSSTFDSNFKSTNLVKKVQRLQKNIQQNKTKLKDLQKELNDKIMPRQNWRNKFKQNTLENIEKKQSRSPSKSSEKFISLQNSQGPEDPWSSNSIEIGSKIPDLNKKPTKNPLIQNPIQTVNPLDKAFPVKSTQPINEKQQIHQSQEVYGRGIAGLRNMKKKEEQKRSSLSRDKHLAHDLKNSSSRGGNLRQLPGSQSPAKMQSNKALPPLSSEKNMTNKPQMQRQQQIAPYPNYVSTPENDSEGDDSYYVDEEGFLIDKEGHRVINEDGEEIQLSYEDIQRLRAMEG